MEMEKKSNLEGFYWNIAGIGKELLLGSFLIVALAWVARSKQNQRQHILSGRNSTHAQVLPGPYVVHS